MSREDKAKWLQEVSEEIEKGMIVGRTDEAYGKAKTIVGEVERKGGKYKTAVGYPKLNTEERADKWK